VIAYVRTWDYPYKCLNCLRTIVYNSIYWGVVRKMMKLKVTCFIVLFLMVSVNLLNTDNFSVAESLEDEETSREVIVPLNSTNIPGFQEGSIYTNTTLSSGFGHTCAILDDGSVSCWGWNTNGQLGDGTTIDRSIPTQTYSLGTGITVVAISSGYGHTCTILDDGYVSCWGYNSHGQLGDGTTTLKNTPTQTSSLGNGRTAIAISSGKFHTCAILDDGTVSCWGGNWDGQLGDGTSINSRSIPTQTSSLGTGRTAVAISSGDYYTCAILDDATVSCWGSNEYGQLGDGTTTSRNTSTQTTTLGTGRTAVAISSGEFHACAILDDASVSCWGYNVNGQLGDGTTTNRNTPTQTSSLGTNRTAVAISSGFGHTCAILDDVSVSCWGGNWDGRLGDGTTSQRTKPTQTSSLGTNRTAVAISSGSSHTCAILDNASVSCWGRGGFGRLGDGDTTNRNTPTQTASIGTIANPRTVALSERDLDGDGILNIYENVICPIGSYESSNNSSLCISADSGTYVDQIGQNNQTPCSANKYNPNTGSTSSSDCMVADRGYYVDSSLGTGQISQTPCSAGTYNPNTGSISSSDCMVADAGYYVDQTTPATQTECAIGTYQALTGQSSCNNSDSGYYVDQTTQTTQTECAIGTYQALTGQSYCDDADAGYYVSTTSQSNQTACLAGTYNPITGSTNSSVCIDADTGYYVSTTAQSNQTACAAGTYQATTGQSSCVKTDIGYYVDQIGQSNQTVCPIYTSTLSPGSQSIAACKLDTDLDKIPDIIDPDDDNDGTIDALDAFPLDDSEDTDADGDGIGDNLQAKLEAKAASEFQPFMLLGGVIGPLLIVISVLIFFKRKGSLSESIKEVPAMESDVTPMKKQVDFVATWEGLPEGEWLENDEAGTHWYLGNDGTHWHSTDDGYQLWDDS